LRFAMNRNSVFTIRNDSIAHYLADISKHQAWWLYSFVAKHGRLFGPPCPLPKGARRGSPKRCFWNAYLLSTTHPELLYVEGFARVDVGQQDFITHHAWTVDSEGKVYDPTWTGTEYFGIPFRPAYVRKMMKKHLPLCCSLLDNSADNYPLKRSKGTRAWLQPMTVSVS